MPSYDMKIYDTIQTYMEHYKGLTENIHRHFPVDSIYIIDKSHLMIVINHEDFEYLRPDTGTRLIIMHKNFLSQHLNNATMVKPDQSFYDPKNNELKFIKNNNPLFTKWYFTQRADRFYGIRPTKLTRIDYNWFFDQDNKCINFVVSTMSLPSNNT